VQNIFEEHNPIQCIMCKMGISYLSFPLKFSLVQDLVSEVMINYVCPNVPQATNVTMCSGIIGSMKNAFWTGVLDSILHPDYSCEELMGICTSSSFVRINAED